MTDQEWEAQNRSLSAAEAQTQGLCWCCTGNKKLFTAFGGVQREVDCGECRGTGKGPR
jgi:hypothetical protein